MAGRKASNAAALVALVIVAAAAAAGAIQLCGVDRSAVAACRPYCKVDSAQASAQASPSALCCAKVKAAQWDCLCQYKDGLPSDIDAARVMSLATQCKCDYPPATCPTN